MDVALFAAEREAKETRQGRYAIVKYCACVLIGITG